MSGEGSNVFNSSNQIIFYSQKIKSEYTSKNVYWLKYDETKKSKRFDNINSEDASLKDKMLSSVQLNRYMSHTVIEKDEALEINSGNFLSIKGMRWIYDKISSKQRTSMDFDLPNLIVDKQNIDFGLRFFNISDGFKKCSVKVFINKIGPFEFKINKETDEFFTMQLPLELFKEKGNTIELEYLASEDKSKGESVVYFDNFEITYPRKLILENDLMTFQTNVETSSTTRTYTIQNPHNKSVYIFDVTEKQNPKIISDCISQNNEIKILVNGTGTRDIIILSSANKQLKPESIKKIKQSKDITFNKENGADYIIVYHEKFSDAIKPLIDFKNSQGLKVYSADVETLYDKYTCGIESPFAIKKFLNDAFRQWENPKPTYVLLVGDCTSDYLGEARNNVINYVPGYSMIADVKFIQDRWTCDNWFTYLTPDDFYPDLLIGRISVNNLEDATNAINKIIHYQQDSIMNSWHKNIGFVCDNGSFEIDVERLINEYTPNAYQSTLISLSKMPWEDNFYLPQETVNEEKAKVSPQTTKMILDYFNSGSAMTFFFGHGSPNIWTDERIWFGGDSENSDNLLLENYDRLPFIVNMTCNSGAIDYPVPKWNICISEDMLRVKNGGAVALYVPSGPGSPSSHFILAREVLNGVFKENLRGLGEITLYAQINYLAQDTLKDTAKMYICLGDPSLNLKINSSKAVVSLNKENTLWDRDDDIEINISCNKITNGSAEVSLFDPEKIKFGNTKEIPVINGSGKTSFKIPAKSKKGRWHFNVYVKSQNNDWEASGGTSFINDIPYATFKKNEYSQKRMNLRDPKAIVSATLYNPSSLNIDKLPIEIYINNKLIETRYISLNSKEEKIIESEIILDEPFNKLLFKLPQYNFSSDPTIEIVTENAIYLPYLIAENKSEIIISQDEITWQIINNQESHQLKLTVPIYNVGSNHQSNMTLYLKDSKGAIIEETKKTIPPIGSGAKQEFSFLIEKEFSILKSEKYHIKIDKSPPDKDLKINDAFFEYSPMNLPDLAINSLKTHIIPASPTEGYTVFVNVAINNMGKTPARNFSVGVYTERPNLGSKLPETIKSMGSENNFTIPYLAPDSSIERVFRWDPINNLDIKKIWILANPTQTIIERDFINNYHSIDIKVLKKGKLKSLGIKMKEQTADELTKHEATLQAKFINEGETPLHKVFVVFFSQKEQNPTTEIGRLFFDEVEPNVPKTAEIKWKYEPNVSYKPSFQIYLKGSLQRISSVETKE